MISEKSHEDHIAFYAPNDPSLFSQWKQRRLIGRTEHKKEKPFIKIQIY